MRYLKDACALTCTLQVLGICAEVLHFSAFIVQVLAFIDIVLWHMLCDGFTYFSQVVGVTSVLPEKVPGFLRIGYQASSNEWLYSGSELLHNGTATDLSHLRSLDNLSCDECVGLFIDKTGSLHIFLNGTYSGRIATGLPMRKKLWGVLDVFFDCTKIKSEMLSGIFVGVCV